MVALLVSVSAAFALGLTSWLPQVLAQDIGIRSVEPGLLTVDRAVSGIVTLGDGYTVSLYRSGFRIAHDDSPMLDTVTRGSPVSAVLGSVSTDGEHPREDVDVALSDLRVTELEVLPTRARYYGTLSDRTRAHRLPVQVTVTRAKGTVTMRVDAQGAHALVLHLHPAPPTRGIAPALPERDLGLDGWWWSATAGGGAAVQTGQPSRIAVSPARSTRALDLRPDGRMDVHVWDHRAALAVTAPPRG